MHLAKEIIEIVLECDNTKQNR